MIVFIILFILHLFGYFIFCLSCLKCFNDDSDALVPITLGGHLCICIGMMIVLITFVLMGLIIRGGL